jgi:MoaA/NifB/PqqE/SkfB family radical SAM enzyme
MIQERSPNTTIDKNNIPFATYGIKENFTQSNSPDIPLRNPPLVLGLHRILIGILIKFNVFIIALRLYPNPLKTFTVLQKLEYLRRQYMGDYNLRKLFKIDGRYYWDMHAPGWPSKAFTIYNEGEMNRIIPKRPISDYLNSMILAITKKCPLNCEHCYEWGEINKKEKLSLEDLVGIVRKFQSKGKGVAQIQLSGGEPLSRYQEILKLLQKANMDTDFWIVSSGYYLTLDKALALKSAGLIGFAFSLDHFNAAHHNSFRGSPYSFDWVMKAIDNAHKAKLAVLLSLCVTREFTTNDNLMKYAKLAKRLGVSFILLLEPRAVGKYAGMDVALSKAQEDILDKFYLKMNFDDDYASYPAVSYHGYHQRRIGCFGGTNRFLYVNTNGELQVCPYCQKKYGNLISGPFDENELKKATNGCLPYQQAKI